MTDWTNSTYLDYAGYGLTVATPAAGSTQSATEAAFGITDGAAVAVSVDAALGDAVASARAPQTLRTMAVGRCA